MTRTIVPKGSVRWAAVNIPLCNIRHLLFDVYKKPGPYQLATPSPSCLTFEDQDLKFLSIGFNPLMVGGDLWWVRG